jgi:hypothetical protein
LAQLNSDYAIGHDEMVAYESLIRTMEVTDMPRHRDIIFLLERSKREEEFMAYWCYWY